MIRTKPRGSFANFPGLTGMGWVDLGSDLISSVRSRSNGSGCLGVAAAALGAGGEAVRR